MRLHLDSEKCQGHGRCYALAPALFTPDDDGYSVLVGDGSVGEADLAAARLAADSCPEFAITLTD